MNKNQFKIFREAIKQTFSIKKIFEELSTLHIQEYLLLFLMTIAQVISFLFTKDASVLVLILSIFFYSKYNFNSCVSIFVTPEPVPVNVIL